jgi:hypothetical protein
MSWFCKKNHLEVTRWQGHWGYRAEKVYFKETEPALASSKVRFIPSLMCDAVLFKLRKQSNAPLKSEDLTLFNGSFYTHTNAKKANGAQLQKFL